MIANRLQFRFFWFVVIHIWHPMNDGVVLSRVIRILRQKNENSAHITCIFCTHFQADFSTLKLLVALLYDSFATLVYVISFT